MGQPATNIDERVPGLADIIHVEFDDGAIEGFVTAVYQDDTFMLLDLDTGKRVWVNANEVKWWFTDTAGIDLSSLKFS